MAAVIGEIESTVESGATSAPSDGQSEGQRDGKALRERLAGELRRAVTRRERLHAD
jgi:hypothetical protein